MVAVVHNGYNFTSLSKREKSVLEYAALGLTNIEIAKIHGTKPSTEKKRFAIIIAKLHARNRTHAVVLAILLGLILPPEVKNDSTCQARDGNPLPFQSSHQSQSAA